MHTDFRVISIGTLAAHPLWNEKDEVRTGHATTTLITTDEATIVVDPGLPGPMLQARFAERTNTQIDDVTHVFLTSFTVDHYRGLLLFGDAVWLLHEPERSAAAEVLAEQRERAEGLGDPDLVRRVGDHESVLHRCRVAGDSIASGVDLFPLPGVTPGACGVLIAQPTSTVLVCGDAVATTEHLEQGKVLPTCRDIEQAQESFREAIEIADVLVLGRDNAVRNPLRRMM